MADRSQRSNGGESLAQNPSASRLLGRSPLTVALNRCRWGCSARGRRPCSGRRRARGAEARIRAWVQHLAAGAEHSLRQAEEQRDPDEHQWIESTSPLVLPIRVTSPKPVVESVATVK